MHTSLTGSAGSNAGQKPHDYRLDAAVASERALTCKGLSASMRLSSNHSSQRRLKSVATVDNQFEPMTIGMVLDRAFRLYTQNFPLMLGITAVLQVPTLILSVTLQLMVPYLRQPSGLGLLVAFSSALFSLITLFVVYPLVTGATTKAVSDKYLGNPVTVGTALKEAWASVGTLLLTSLVANLIIGLGFLLLIVPGVLWAMSYALIPPIVMIEASDRTISRQVYSLTGAVRTVAPPLMDRSDIRRRSWDLVRGNRGKVFVVIAVLIVMRMLISSGAGWMAGLALDTTSDAGIALRSILANGINIVVSPLQTIAVTLLYYDFRIRKEGFDIEMLSQAMGTPTVNT
jgi:hypothetical protein